MFDMHELTAETAENVETAENAEATENTEKTAADLKQVSGKIGYSSDHYQWEMSNAIKNNNQIAYDNAKRNYADAKAREEAAKIHY